MTHFDELLQRAFASGYNRGYDTAKADDGHHVTKMAPAFNDWRATLSGLDVRETGKFGETIAVGNIDGSTIRGSR